MQEERLNRHKQVTSERVQIDRDAIWTIKRRMYMRAYVAKG